jgi:uncharacterized membrane protein
MATASLAPRRTSVRVKYVLFAVIAMMYLYVLQHNERFLINSADPVWQHYQSFKWWLLPHGLAGACAIFLGPMQFSDRLRQRYAKVHRVLGRIYVAGALVVAPLGVYIQHINEPLAGRSFTIAAGVDAALLMFTTGMAFAFILKGKVQQHRQWMTRSYAVALVFIEVRVIGGITGWESVAAVETTVWCCLAFSVLSADLVLQFQELRRARPAARVAAAS